MTMPPGDDRFVGGARGMSEHIDYWAEWRDICLNLGSQGFTQGTPEDQYRDQFNALIERAENERHAATEAELRAQVADLQNQVGLYENALADADRTAGELRAQVERLTHERDQAVLEVNGARHTKAIAKQHDWGTLVAERDSLRAEVERLREAGQQIVTIVESVGRISVEDRTGWNLWTEALIEAKNQMRAALATAAPAPGGQPHKPTEACVDNCDNPYVCAEEWENAQAGQDEPNWYERAITAEKTLRLAQNDLVRLREQHSVMLDDFADIGQSLGVNVHARPESPQQVVEEIKHAAKVAAGQDERRAGE